VRIYESLTQMEQTVVAVKLHSTSLSV